MNYTARTIYLRFDWLLLLSVLALGLVGILIIYSATNGSESEFTAGLFQRQIWWLFLGSILLFTVVFLPPKLFYVFAYYVYILGLILLSVLFIKSLSSAGVERWFNLPGGVKIQPSELAKMGMILALAKYLAHNPVSVDKLSSLIIPFLILFFPVLMILQQPDLGTAMVFCGTAVPLLFWGGLNPKDIFFMISPLVSLILAYHWLPWSLFFIGLVGLVLWIRPNLFFTLLILAGNLLAGVFTAFFWSRLHDYQKNRILGFINPESDPSGYGYQAIQSKITLGSGGFSGKGWMAGTQTKLNFLPEQHTDFIFSVLGEQFGFIGCLLVIFLFIIVTVRILFVTHMIRNRFYNLTVVGVAAVLLCHMFINIGMTTGLMPVTGLPLPFLSYGGSSLLTFMVLIGMVLNIQYHKGEL